MAIIIESIDVYDVDIGTSIYFDFTSEQQGFEIQYSTISIYTETGLLICSHKQTGDNKVHTLPEKNDSTIQYYSEEMKAEYVNGKKYYMTVMVKFVGVPKILYSERVMFYCFETPSIAFINPPYGETVTTYIPAYTCSVDVKIIYPYPALVSQTNKVQKYEFKLYNKNTGELVQSSGQTLGTGINISSEVEGDKIVYKYRLEYAFRDLEPNNLYRVEVEVTTESGMFKYSDDSGEVKYERVAGTAIFRSVANMSSRGSIRVSVLDISYHEIPVNVRVERKAIDGNKWINLATLPYNGQQTTLIDSSVENGVTYIYRPVLIYDIAGVEYEIVGVKSDEVKCCFEGVILSDAESFIRLDTAIYTGMQVNQTTGIHNPLGSRYPIVVVNSSTNYHTGGVGGRVLNDSFGKKKSDGTYGDFDEYEAVKRRKELDRFLTNKKPKLLKDSFGTIFIVMITEAPTYEFEEWNNALATINFNYTEIGDATNSNDIMRIMGWGGVS